MNKFILKGPELRPDPTDNCHSLGEYLINKIKENQNEMILINGKTSIELKLTTILSESIKCAISLRDNFGIKNGDIVAICCENCFEFIYILFGTIFLGATFAPYNTSNTEDELHYVINLSRPKIMFASSQTISTCAKIMEKNSYIEKLIVIINNNNNTIFDIRNKIISYESFREYASEFPTDTFICNPVKDMNENVCLLMCSSGTTGLPKGVQLTQLNLLITLTQILYQKSSALNNEIYPYPINFSVGPWFHIYGCILILNMVTIKNTTVYLPKFKDTLFLKCIEKYKVNTVFLVPPLMIFLAKNPLVSNYDLSSIKTIICGAAPLQKEIEQAVRKRLNDIPVIRQGYAMTEGVFTTQNDNYNKTGSVGGLRAGVSGKVICPETGRLLGANQSGELLFKGKGMTKGYIGDVFATENIIDKDGWLHTGDIGYYDENGEWFIIDRLKELIKFKGYQVAPAEIESILLTHPKIVDAAVIGIPDDFAGELPIAFVVLLQNTMVTKEEIIDFVTSNISYTKRLHGGVIFVNEIPKNPSGKILRRKLKEYLQENIRSQL